MLSEDYGNGIIGHITGQAELSAPSSTVISIHSGDPGATGANEHAYSGYARQAVTWNAASLGVPASNDGDITFPAAPAGGITISHIGIWDDGGTFIMGIAIASRTFPEGTSPKLVDGVVQVSATGDFSNYLKHRIVNHILGISAFTKPTTVYLAVIDDEAAEFSGGDYARSATAFDAPGGKEIVNAAEEDFGTASADLGTTDAFGIYDALTTGNLLVSGLWDTPAEVLNGDGYKVPDGGITITIV